MGFLGKNTGYVSLLLNHIRALPWDSHHTLGFSGGAFCAPRLVTGNIKKTLLKGQDLIKLFFFCFSRHIVKWNGHLRALLWVCSSGEHDDCLQGLLPLPRFVSRARHSSHLCFQTIKYVSAQGKRQIAPWYFWSWGLWEGLRDPAGP